MKLKKGFTVIEMLIVVAIMGILFAIAIPQFQRYNNGGVDPVRSVKGTTLCLNGWTIVEYNRIAVHKLDNNGRPIPCN